MVVSGETPLDTNCASAYMSHVSGHGDQNNGSLTAQTKISLFVDSFSLKFDVYVLVCAPVFVLGCVLLLSKGRSKTLFVLLQVMGMLDVHTNSNDQRLYGYIYIT